MYRLTNAQERRDARTLTLIADLAHEIQWRKTDGYVSWLRHNMDLERVRTSGDAARVIEGLKGIKRRHTRHD